ncbi:hypothetical protein [Pseudonocardia nigra]|uniref:hypothetical protein n=1 Tax=Pseudonocardia nigra TaxID=1921578 RepID=UPI001C5E573E|nr:hypothetical protein [Pseudonocardia nigra]
MHPPPTPQVRTRMCAAHDHARAALGLRLGPAPDSTEAWGWNGRTLGRPVDTPTGPGWLRLAAAPSGHTDHVFWSGNHDADAVLPVGTPRPARRANLDWHDHTWSYRAELFDHTTDPPISPTATLTDTPTLPPRWWAELRATLTAISAVPTSRHTTDQHYLDWSVPTFLDPDMDTTTTSWTTAHGDLHWANLCAPRLQILDWEGFGRAPAGYDAVMLHTHSLLAPDLAEHVHAELAATLDTPTGRFAELAVIAELLHNAADGNTTIPTRPLRRRAAHLLDRAKDD